MRHFAWKLIGTLVVLAASVATAQAKPRTAGEAIAVDGAVTQQKAGATLTPVSAGTAVLPGNTVVTGAESSVRLRMTDNSYLALPPDSALQVERFVLPRAGKTKDPGTAVFSLSRGGFRTITGLIGKVEQDTYEVKTPVATLGIKGTEYSAFMCTDCNPAGLYVEVHSGVVVVSNSNGLVTLTAGQFAFVSNVSGSAPEKLSARPAVFEVMGGIFTPAVNISAGARGSAGPDGVVIQPEPPRIEPPASPSSP